jgi:hypothetical protein
MRQVLHRERAKNWPKIPQSLEEYDSGKEKNSLKTGGKVICEWFVAITYKEQSSNGNESYKKSEKTFT